MEREDWSENNIVNLTESSFTISPGRLNTQVAQVPSISNAETECLTKNWTSNIKIIFESTYCKAAWDGITCWPPALPGETVHKACSELVSSTFVINVKTFSGFAFRSCSTNGLWIGGYSNYSYCVRQIKEGILHKTPDLTSPIGSYIPFIMLTGSILSVLCLACAIFIYSYLNSLYLGRLKILRQMMTALLIKSVLWILMVLPNVFPKSFDFKNWEWACKCVILFHFYSLLVSTFWMLALGHYMNSKLTKTRFWSTVSRMKYYSLCWGMPMLIIGTWGALMTLTQQNACWLNYTQSKCFLIIFIPILTAFLVNLMYLANILRTVLQRVPFIQTPYQLQQIRKAKRDIAILCPVLGVNNLLFVYNPGGSYEAYYMLFHAFCQSIQGCLVSIMCCFISARVYKAFWKKLKRCYSSRPSYQVTPGNRLIRPRGRTNTKPTPRTDAHTFELKDQAISFVQNEWQLHETGQR